MTGDGTPDLALGADGENAGDGTVLTLSGGPGGVVTESGAYCGPTAPAASAAAGIGGVLAK
ncbi:hypothetical protein [Streptomyces sp. NBC_01615]|uniref:hypothetical protein n=1 Tax=Streptomyces sp. NBC_01615 TaxID=2975898 RepID=UPI003865F26B